MSRCARWCASVSGCISARESSACTPLFCARPDRLRERSGAEGAAWIALEDDDIDYAITCLERAARHERVESQRRATHWRTVARLRYERSAGDLAAAVSCLQEASLLDPDGRAEDLRQAALWWREVGQLERALSCVEARLELPGEARGGSSRRRSSCWRSGDLGKPPGAAALADDELAPQIFPGGGARLAAGCAGRRAPCSGRAVVCTRARVGQR